MGQHIAEVNPAVENEMVRQEDQRADLSEQARRANGAFISQFMPEQEHQQHLARIRKEKEAADARLFDLLGASVVSAAMSDGLAWETWAPIKKRNFLSHLVARVEVAPWPHGHPTALTRRRGEDEAVHRARFDASQRAAMEKRVAVTHANRTDRRRSLKSLNPTGRLDAGLVSGTSPQVNGLDFETLELLTSCGTFVVPHAVQYRLCQWGSPLWREAGSPRMKFAEVLEQALADVREAGIPPELQELAFREALRFYVGAADGSAAPSVGTSAPAADDKASNGSRKAQVGDPLVLLAQESGVDQEELAHLFYFGDSGPEFNVPARKLGANSADRQRSVALLITGARHYGLNELEIPVATIREVCVALGVYDRKNFSTYMGSVPGLLMTGPRGNKAFRVKMDGKTKFKQKVSEIVGKPESEA